MQTIAVYKILNVLVFIKKLATVEGIPRGGTHCFIYQVYITSHYKSQMSNIYIYNILVIFSLELLFIGGNCMKIQRAV